MMSMAAAHGTLMPQSSSAAPAEDNIIMMPPQPEPSSELGFPKNITPDKPAHHSSLHYNENGAAVSDSGSSEHNNLPPPAFASFFGSRFPSRVIDAAAACQQPRSLKNHDELYHHDRLQLEPFSPSEDSTYESPMRNIPSMISTQRMPSSPLMMSPMRGGVSSDGKSPNKKRSMEGRDDFSTCSEDEQPHTPKYRCLLQSLTLNSPSRTSESGTPEEGGGSVGQSPYRRPPNIPSFVKKKKNFIMPTDSFESQSFPAANTPLRTPERGMFFMKSSEKISTPTTAGSSFHSFRSNRTSIGHQNSPFKMLPPRLDRDQSQGSNDTLDMIHSSSSPFVSSPTRYASSSPFTSSPSPRVVPLKILSRDGSPIGDANLACAMGVIPKLGMDHLPYDPSTSSQAVMSSPLMRSLDLYAKNDSMEQMAQDDTKEDEEMPGVAMPTMYGGSPKSTMHGESPKSSEDYLKLPRIKLTPRSKSNCASLMLDVSPHGAAPPCLNLFPSSGPQLKKRTENSGDEEAAEMDSLLNGFGHYDASDDEARNAKQSRSNDFLGRVESEESEMVAIARTPLLLPSFCTQAKYQKGVQMKPMKSITFKSPEHDRDERLGSPSFLPRFLPAAKSRSLFHSSHADDPIEQILRADAIAEAAKSNEELTDDESDSEGPGSDFLLCSPKSNASKMLHKMEKRPTRRATLPLKPGHRAESPSFGRCRASSIGSLKKRTRSFSSPTTPTIAEEGLSSFEAIFGNSSTSNEGTLQGSTGRYKSSFCSLSDCDDTTTSHHHSHPMPTSIGVGMKTIGMDYPHSSLLSMSSLCGLDIVDESTDELRDKVSASLSSVGMVGLRRSEFSQNSLGLSVDSVGDGEQRDLFTPPVTTIRSLQSPPPLPKRPVNYQLF